MSAYCKKVGADMDSVRFLFDGDRIRPDQTPGQLDMEDADIIDAMVWTEVPVFDVCISFLGLLASCLCVSNFQVQQTGGK